MERIDKLFNPMSVAVIGASRSPRKIGHIIFRNFVENNYKGKMFPVNPNITQLFGVKCYPSVSKIKERVDLAVIALPSPLVPDSLEQCGKKRIPSAIVVSGGFKEIGRKDLEDRLKQIAEKYRMKVLGPNCLGIFDAYSGVDTNFTPRYKLERPEKGNISLISQSGATMAVLLDWMAMKGYKVSKCISYGNAAVIDESDLLEYVARDKRTKAICLYFEGVKNGRKFFETCSRISRKMPVIALKAGNTEAGSAAVTSHTGSLAGSVAVYRAAFRQSGIIEATDLEQIFDFARMLSKQPLPKGERVQIITNGGGYGVLAADRLVGNGLKLARMRPSRMKNLRKSVSTHAVLSNPIDLTGDGTTQMYSDTIKAALEDPGVDIIMIITLFQLPLLTPDVTEVITEASKKRKKPIIVVSAGGRYSEVLKKSLENSGVPCFSYADGAAKALKALCGYGMSVS